MSDESTIREPEREHVRASPVVNIGLVVVWSARDPAYVGAWLPARHEQCVLGRGAAEAADDVPRLEALRQRPESNVLLPPLENPLVSRRQLELRPHGSGSLAVKNVGRCGMRVDGGPETSEALLRAGDLVSLGAQLVLRCCQRPFRLPATTADRSHAFGEVDRFGYVGESPAAWRLRTELAFAGGKPGHVLLRGPSGSGKELVAAALHTASLRSGQFIARNAATLPEALLDAELFGNAKNYPNPGMLERHGLVGSADGGTLFLDEFGELPLLQQAHLLRAMDAGEYQRLGEAQVRRSAFRMLGATNQPDSALRDDVLARFSFVIDVPGLPERREDVPFLLRYLAKGMLVGDDPIMQRFISPSGEPRLGASLVVQAIRDASNNIRHLRNILWKSIAESSGDELVAVDLPSMALAPLAADQNESLPDTARLRAILDANEGSVEKTWRALGLSSRHALVRLMKKHGVEIKRRTRTSSH